MATLNPVRHRLTRFTSGELEALKWLALAAMVADHVDLLWLERSWPALHAFGRLAFPLFALVFGYNLARPHVDGIRVAGRLALPAALASLVWAYTGTAGLPPLNVLWAFALFAVAVELWDEHPRTALAALVVGGLFVEGNWFGQLLAFAGLLIGRRPSHWFGYALAVLGIVLLQAVNGSAWALLAVPAVLAVRAWRPDVPHVPGLFLWFYPVHLAALVFARMAV